MCSKASFKQNFLKQASEYVGIVVHKSSPPIVRPRLKKQTSAPLLPKLSRMKTKWIFMFAALRFFCHVCFERVFWE